MMDKIHAKASLINFDDPSNLITLAKEPFSRDPSLRSK